MRRSSSSWPATCWPCTSRTGARSSGPRAARRSQYPLAALMVAYTMVSLWILAQPIVETGR
jgi:hypothetical protein